MRSSHPKKLGDILGKVLARYGYAHSTARLELEQTWKEVAGARSGEHTKVGSLRRGVLEILVDSSTLLQELDGFEKESLLERLRERLRQNNVRLLRFRRM